MRPEQERRLAAAEARVGEERDGVHSQRSRRGHAERDRRDQHPEGRRAEGLRAGIGVLEVARGECLRAGLVDAER